MILYERGGGGVIVFTALIKEKGADAFEFKQEVLEGKHKGLWTHSNVRATKSDMFPQPELMDMLTSL